MPNANLPAIEIFSLCAKARDQAAGEFGKAKEDVASSLPCDLDQYKELLSFDEELAAAEEEAEAEAKVRGMRNASACIPACKRMHSSFGCIPALSFSHAYECAYEHTRTVRARSRTCPR
jgi:hypothetical protein